MTSEYQFHNFEGREIIARLMGAPGAREIEFSIRGMPHGRACLKDVLADKWSAMLAPHGNVDGCADIELVVLGETERSRLAAWSQAEALGRDEGEEE